MVKRLHGKSEHLLNGQNFYKMNSPIGKAKPIESNIKNMPSNKRKRKSIQQRQGITRKSEADIRNEHLDQGAILIQFVPHKNANNAIIQQRKSIEKYGFLVTERGCLIPYKQYWVSKGGRDRGCSIGYQFFNGKRADTTTKTNIHGWPSAKQYSHLCHMWNCASPACIIVEEQWKNLKRTYCEVKGVCNCHCVDKRMQTFDGYYERNIFLSYDTSGLKNKIQTLLAGISFKILPKNYYAVEDLKRSNRLLRRKRQKKQNK